MILLVKGEPLGGKGLKDIPISQATEKECSKPGLSRLKFGASGLLRVQIRLRARLINNKDCTFRTPSSIVL